MSRAITDTPMMAPASSLIGDQLTVTATRKPSRCSRMVSTSVITSPANARSNIDLLSSKCSGGHTPAIGWPSISAAGRPSSRSAAAFQVVTVMSAATL
jgi:hypothetical protein